MNWQAFCAQEEALPSPHVFWGVGAARVPHHCPGGLVYLATPYSREVVDGSGQWSGAANGWQRARADGAMRALMLAGVTGVSPISLAAGIVLQNGYATPVIDPLDATLWAGWCAPMLGACGSLWVPELDGWCRSAGICHEVAVMRSRNCPVLFEATVGMRHFLAEGGQ